MCQKGIRLIYLVGLSALFACLAQPHAAAKQIAVIVSQKNDV
jgi:hypothetical protein